MDGCKLMAGCATCKSNGLLKVAERIERLQRQDSSWRCHLREIASELSTIHFSHNSARVRNPLPSSVSTPDGPDTAVRRDTVDQHQQSMMPRITEVELELAKATRESLKWRNECDRQKSRRTLAERVGTLTKRRALRESHVDGDRELDDALNRAEDCQSTRVDARRIASLRRVDFNPWSVATRMFQSDALTTRELDAVRSKRDRPSEAAVTLIDIVECQPCEVYECFLDALKQSNQNHVYEGLVTEGWEDGRIGSSVHSIAIRTNYVYLLEAIETMHSLLLQHLSDREVIERSELEDIKAERTPMRQVDRLLSVLRYKSPAQFELFLDALDETGQRHVRNKITGREDIEVRSLPAVLQRNGQHKILAQLQAAKANRFGSYLQEQVQLQTELKLKSQEIDRLSGIIKELEHRTTDAKEQSLAEAEQRVRDLEKRLQEKEIEIESINGKSTELIRALEEAIRDKQRELESMDENLRESIRCLEEKLEEKERTICSLKHDLDELPKEILRQRSEEKCRFSDNVTLSSHGELWTWKTTEEQLREKVRDLEAELSKLLRERSISEATLGDCQQQLKDMDSDLARRSQLKRMIDHPDGESQRSELARRGFIARATVQMTSCPTQLNCENNDVIQSSTLSVYVTDVKRQNDRRAQLRSRDPALRPFSMINLGDSPQSLGHKC